MARSQECRVVHPLDERRKDKVSTRAVDFGCGRRLRDCLGRLAGRVDAENRHLAGIAFASGRRGRHFPARNAALAISAAWTVPVGVAIGLNPKLARIVQPVAQVLASVPATAFFPILLIGLVKIGGGLGIGSLR